MTSTAGMAILIPLADSGDSSRRDSDALMRPMLDPIEKLRQLAPAPGAEADGAGPDAWKV